MRLRWWSHISCAAALVHAHAPPPPPLAYSQLLSMRAVERRAVHVCRKSGPSNTGRILRLHPRVAFKFTSWFLQRTPFYWEDRNTGAGERGLERHWRHSGLRSRSGAPCHHQDGHYQQQHGRKRPAGPPGVLCPGCCRRRCARETAQGESS